MQTVKQVKTSDKLKEVIGRGFKKSSIAKTLGISRPTLDARLNDNAWSDETLNKINASGLI